MQVARTRKVAFGLYCIIIHHDSWSQSTPKNRFTTFQFVYEKDEYANLFNKNDRSILKGKNCITFSKYTIRFYLCVICQVFNLRLKWSIISAFQILMKLLRVLLLAPKTFNKKHVTSVSGSATIDKPSILIIHGCVLGFLYGMTKWKRRITPKKKNNCNNKLFLHTKKTFLSFSKFLYLFCLPFLSSFCF